MYLAHKFCASVGWFWCFGQFQSLSPGVAPASVLVVDGWLRIQPTWWTSQVALVLKNPPVNATPKRCGFNPWRRARQPIPVLLPGECHGQTSLAGYNPWGRKELDMTEHTSVDTDSVKNFFFILCIYLFMFGCAESSLPRGLFLL